jgi:hypothetical protein
MNFSLTVHIYIMNMCPFVHVGWYQCNSVVWLTVYTPANAFHTPWQNYWKSGSSPHFSRPLQDSGALGIQIVTRDVPELDHFFLFTLSLRQWIKWRVQCYKNFELRSYFLLLHCVFFCSSFRIPIRLTSSFSHSMVLLFIITFISNNIYFHFFLSVFQYLFLFLYFLGFFCILSISFLPFPYLLHFLYLSSFSLFSLY